MHPGIALLERGHQWLVALMMFDTASVRAKVCLLLLQVIWCVTCCCVCCTASIKMPQKMTHCVILHVQTLVCMFLQDGDCNTSVLSHVGTKMNNIMDIYVLGVGQRCYFCRRAVKNVGKSTKIKNPPSNSLDIDISKKAGIAQAGGSLELRPRYTHRLAQMVQQPPQTTSLTGHCYKVKVSCHNKIYKIYLWAHGPSVTEQKILLHWSLIQTRHMVQVYLRPKSGWTHMFPCGWRLRLERANWPNFPLKANSRFIV